MKAMKYLVLVFLGHCGVVVDRCGVVVDRCGSLWIVVGHCGSFRVLVTTMKSDNLLLAK